jgi:NAD(P)-dependent dehydrogenase (short-subunit alcohol dehydrogenase family)
MESVPGGKIMAGLFNGRVALVTGAASGIGRAAALAFACEGARVVVAEVAVEGGEETVRLIRNAGGEASFVVTDVSKSDEVRFMVQRAVETYGRLDCAFNNAGIEGIEAVGIPFHEYPEEIWDRVVSINLKGVWLCIKAEISQMLQQGGGVIVNTASVYGLVGGGGPAYGPSKFGVVGLTKTAALAYAQQGIRVNAVCPGAVRTPLLDRVIARTPEAKERLRAAEPVGRFGTPEEIAAAVVWLCSEAASFVTGIAMPVDGGWVAR